jgi:hypothetical protein
MNRFFPAILTAAFLVASAPSAQAAEGDGTSTAAGVAKTALTPQVAALLATYPTGGKELEDALAALLDEQADPAGSVAELIAALGARPSPGQIAAAGNAIRRAAKYTVEQLQTAIAELIVASDDPVLMAMNTIAISPYLDDAGKAAIGVAIARAITVFRTTGRTAVAAVIDVEIATGEDGPLKEAYIAERGEVFPTTGTRQNDTTAPLEVPPNFEPQTGSPS